MSDVFISHSSKDKEIADQVVKFLEDRGLSCWIAPRNIVPGTDWAEAINTAVTASKVFLIIYSENSSKSSQVAREISLAETKPEVYVVPYKIDDTPLVGSFEYYLVGSHFIAADYSKEDYKLEDLYKIVSGIVEDTIHNINDYSSLRQQGKLMSEPGGMSESGPLPKKSGLPLIIGLAAVAVLAVVGVILFFTLGPGKNGGSDPSGSGKAPSGNEESMDPSLNGPSGSGSEDSSVTGNGSSESSEDINKSSEENGSEGQTSPEDKTASETENGSETGSETETEVESTTEYTGDNPQILMMVYINKYGNHFENDKGEYYSLKYSFGPYTLVKAGEEEKAFDTSIIYMNSKYGTSEESDVPLQFGIFNDTLREYVWINYNSSTDSYELYAYEEEKEGINQGIIKAPFPEVYYGKLNEEAFTQFEESGWHNKEEFITNTEDLLDLLITAIDREITENDSHVSLESLGFDWWQQKN